MFCLCVFSMYHTRIRRRCSTSWNWSYGQLWSAMWVLGTKPRSPTEKTRAHKCQAISPALNAYVFNAMLYATQKFFLSWVSFSQKMTTWRQKKNHQEILRLSVSCMLRNLIRKFSTWTITQSPGPLYTCCMCFGTYVKVRGWHFLRQFLFL